MENTFDGLANKFDMNNEFVMPPEEFTDKKDELIKKVESENFEDKDFLQEEIKQLIHQGKLVLDKINKDLKVGSQPRMFEVYGSVFNSVMSGMKELRELNKNMADIDVKSKGTKKTSVNLQLTAKELALLVKDTTKELNNTKMKIEPVEIKPEEVS